VTKIHFADVNCTVLLNCTRDNGNTAGEKGSEDMVLGAVRALCQFSLLVSQQDDPYLTLTAEDYAQKRFYKKLDAFKE